MKAFLTIVGLLFAESVFALPSNINSNQAKLYINQNANVCGKVVRIGYDKYSHDHFFDIDKAHPNEIFSFHIPSTTKIDLHKYLNRNICGFGRVKEFMRPVIRDNSRIIYRITINNESQISLY